MSHSAALSRVEIVEVAPRDGLQNEKTEISTADKLALISRAIAYGARRIEVTSFVSPKAVPQMADADAVCAGLPERDDVTYVGLVMNLRGAERALATGRIDQLGAVAVASDAFAHANQRQTAMGSVEVASQIVSAAKAAGKSGQVTIGAAFGCPFTGEVDEALVVEMAAALAQCGPAEIGLADTIGVADPAHVARLFAAVRAVVGDIPLRAHFHNTRGTGLANVWSAVQAGVGIIDASLGGIGGCPFAPGASGNVAGEDVAYMLARAGVSTGYDLPQMVDAAQWLGGVMGRGLPAMVSRAPLFPTGVVAASAARAAAKLAAQNDIQVSEKA
ncbi:hydroxymethylglutaryl-CoA lyase [Novosphingobium sp. FSY-8]|uniref:Hydroxymethylglutaryl-CoA lyase n=1 Tax=Novosphingobium ovatum TaxID=1908523 RepID=A0ABW9X9L3_9SPHN|nr:hydroxymethylglutaryl-CoA lyase [Novosphingobium ovatum]NBC35216.1 hydroxymethylglutaryl-CoA lyase [Novosphingobium ovatum]